MPSELLGLSILPLGCFSSATGLLLMKSSTELQPELPPWRSWRWLLGFSLLGIVATSIEVVVLRLLPISLVAPFSGLTICFSLAVASTGLIVPAELLCPHDYCGIFLILVGVTGVGMFGPHGNDSTVDALVSGLTQPAFVVFAMTSVLAALSRLWVVRSSARAAPTGVVLSAYSAASCGALSQLMLKLLAMSANTLATGGLLTVCVALALLGVLAPLHLHLLNLTLASGSVSVAVPLYQCLLISVGTCTGGVFFGEFAHVSSYQLMGYCAGVAAAAGGLAVLSLGGDDGNILTPSEGSPSSEDVPLQDSHEPLPSVKRVSLRMSTSAGCRRRASSQLMLPMGFAAAHLYLEHLHDQASRNNLKRSCSLPAVELRKVLDEMKMEPRRARSVSMLCQ
ncbi:hypothetical protein AB1Y20_012496 [Prymnesium parvum]|uniref:Magnesium transporter n=1 Tax=Prymnesium parvum TaxID=97485 RepID=A0AB34ILH5_PRYPA